MKLIVETTGSFQVYAGPDCHARHDRPSVVLPLQLIHRELGVGKLRVLGQVNDEATDEELVKYLAEAKGDQDLAVQSFISSFPVEKPAENPVTEKPTPPKKGKPE